MRESHPFLGTTSNFHEAFPEIQKIEVEFEQDRFGWHLRGNDYMRKRHFNESNIQTSIYCCNSRCNRGGVNIENRIRSMTYSRQTEALFTGICDGDEGSPKGRNRGKPCTNGYEIKIKVTYKASIEKS